jgi:protein SCO1
MEINMTPIEKIRAFIKSPECREKIKLFFKKPWPWIGLAVIVAVIYVLSANFTKDTSLSPVNVNKSTTTSTRVETVKENIPGIVASAPIDGTTVTNFALLNQDGEPFGSKELKKSPYVVNLFFTECLKPECPERMRLMKGLQDKYERENSSVKIVSISVDAHNDRPEDMKKYANQFGADYKRWIFLTGPKANARQVIEAYGFTFGQKELNKDGIYDVVYDNKALLVDRDGKILATFKVDERGIEDLFRKSSRLR